MQVSGEAVPLAKTEAIAKALLEGMLHTARK